MTAKPEASRDYRKLEACDTRLSKLLALGPPPVYYFAVAQPPETIAPMTILAAAPAPPTETQRASSPQADRHSSIRATYQKISSNIGKVMRGQAGSTRKLLAALASGGHVLLED